MCFWVGAEHVAPPGLTRFFLRLIYKHNTPNGALDTRDIGASEARLRERRESASGVE